LLYSYQLLYITHSYYFHCPQRTLNYLLKNQSQNIQDNYFMKSF